MKLMKNEELQTHGRHAKSANRRGRLGMVRGIVICLLAITAISLAGAQALSTTSVQGTVYLANGRPGAGTLVVSWPTFTTAAGQVVAADSTTVTIAPDGFVSVNLAPNVGSTPAGEYYTAVFYMSDGSASSQYWVVPAAAQATLAQVQSQVMPAAQAVQAVSKTYVDQSISELTQSFLTASGGNLNGPLYLNGDPTQALQAADKHYVDSQMATALPLSGGTLTGAFSAPQIGALYQADQFPGADFGAKLQACLNALNTTYGGTCDARNFTDNQAMGSNLTISTGNTAVLLPCATIATANQIIVVAGTRNVALRGCAIRGGTAASGSQGGTVFAYSGTGAMVQVGDPTYSVDTPGFHMDDLVINTTGASSAAQGLVAYRTQEADLEDLYLLGNSNQTGMTLDGTGNYTGGTFLNDQISGFGTAVNAIGHQVSNPAPTDWMNASSFVRLHIDCPTSNGNPINGTYGINLRQGDGNTFTGGDIEGCSTALHLGPNAQNNTIVGLRNENSTNQVVADAGSSYNNWISGGTMFNGKLTDNGTRNSFLDTFHRSFNGLNGDWYGSQQDATVTNHYRLGLGNGNERGLLNRYQTDYGYRWTTGLSDATAGEQFYQVLDELNNVYRLSIGQYNSGQSSTNDQTVINSAGTGAVVLNGSNNAGTGGVLFGSGGPSQTTVATVSNAGNAQFNGTLQVGGTSQSTGTMTVRNNADAEVDYYLWPGLTTSQKGSFTYKDWNGNSQWYMVKDASNNWSLNSATGGLDSLKAYQSTNSGDTYINASNSTGHVRMNYESGSGAETDIYSGSSANLDAAFLGPSSIKFPGLAASSGHFCMQVDSSGYLTNTGSPCGSGSGGTTGIINSGNSGQIAYYTTNGTTVGGMSAVPVIAGGTGAATAAAALTNLGAVSSSGGTMSGALTAPGFNGPLTGNVSSMTSPWADIRSYGGAVDGVTDIGPALNNAIAAQCPSSGGTGGTSCAVLLPCGGPGCYLANGNVGGAPNGTVLEIKLQGNLKLGSTLALPDNVSLVGNGGGYPSSFQANGATAQITGPRVYGMMGTATTTTGSPVTFTPTFGLGTIANMPVGSAITVAGTITCSATASSDGYWTTFTTSTQCRIPVLETINITGCSDSSFNGSGIPVSNSDYPAQTITIHQTGTGSSASGCSISGFNDDSFETVRITAVSGSTVTATFSHPHSASDFWGMVAIAPVSNTFAHHDFENIAITGNYGAGLWLDNIADITLLGVGVSGASGSMTSIPMEMDGAWWGRARDLALVQSGEWQCSKNCTVPNYPYALRCSQDAQRNNGIGCSGIAISDSTLLGGIKVDTNNQPANQGTGLVLSLHDVTIEQATANAITVDPRSGLGGVTYFLLDNVEFSDNSLGNSPAFVGGTDGCVNGYADIREASQVSALSLVNKYYCGTAKASPTGSYALPTGRGAKTGIYDDGGTLEAELRGEGASLGPSIVPYKTLPASLSCPQSNCSSVLSPDGTADATEVQGVSSGSGNASAGSVSLSTYPGDMLLFWSWVKAGKGTSMYNSPWGSISFLVETTGTDTWTQSAGSGAITPYNFDMRFASGDWWHPVVALTQVITGQSAAHTISFILAPPCTAGGSGCNTPGIGNDFYSWGWMFIPGPNNPAYNGVTEAEVERWRQQLLHGAVPQNFNGVGVSATTAPLAAPQYNVLNPSTGAYAPFGTANLADWTNNGVINGSVPTWNSTTNKWTPGSPGGVADVAISVLSGTQAANSCSAKATAGMPGLSTSMVLLPGYSSDPTSIIGWGSSGGMVFQAWPDSANTLGWRVCNQTTASITYGAITFNVGAK